jgi:hypothetical protein
MKKDVQMAIPGKISFPAKSCYPPPAKPTPSLIQLRYQDEFQ